MDVPQAKLPSVALRILQEVADSHFVSFDFEFSGVAARRANRTGKLTLQETYEDAKAAAEKYQILQVGLTIVQEDVRKGRYIVRPYNFNLSPIPALSRRAFTRDWSFNSDGKQSSKQTLHC